MARDPIKTARAAEVTAYIDGSDLVRLRSIVETVTARHAHELESITSVTLPFAQPRLIVLLVFSPSALQTWSVYKAIEPAIIEKVNLICLRVTELFQLGLPCPDATLQGLPEWIASTGSVLWGADLRAHLPVGKRDEPRLAYQLELAQSCRHRIIERLMRNAYDDLHTYLGRERTLLAYTALLQRGIWRVHPGTLQQHFRDAYPDQDLKTNETEWQSVQARARLAAADEQKHLAYKAVWLFERFLRELWRHAS
jgi:hypothetical protein